MHSILHYLKETRTRDTGATDERLLDRWLARGDSAAFAALVNKHGPMVMGVCRRLLCNQHDAEDAFQAVFLVLVRKARSIRQRDQIGGWLYGVAYRLALKLRSEVARQRRHEQALPEQLPDTAVSRHEDADWRPALDREVSHLPDRYRLPIVLCLLEGRSRKEAAEQLGWTEGALSGRLARARQLLAKRLARHGIGATGWAGLSAALAHEFASDASINLIQPTAANAVAFAKIGAANVISERVLQWTEKGITIMKIQQIKRCVLLSVMVMVLGVGLLAGLHQVWAARLFTPAKPANDRQLKATKPQQTVPKKKKAVGRIFFWRKNRMASVKPNGKDFKWHSQPMPRSTSMRDPHWSPDGRMVVYGQFKPPSRAPGDKKKEHLATFDIYVKSTQEKGLGKKMPIRGHYWRWLADGNRLLVSRMAPGDPQSWLVDVQTEKVTELPLPSRHFATDVSADGRWLLTTTIPDKDKRAKAPPAIYVVKTDSVDARRLIPEQSAVGQSAFAGRFSPDGRNVLYLGMRQKAGKRTTALYLIGTAGGKPRRISQELNAIVEGFCWSPDGKQIAYVWRQRHETPQPQQPTESFLMVVGADGRNPRTVLSLRSQRSSQTVLRMPSWR